MQQGGSQYGVPPPEMTPFSPTGSGTARAHVLGISGPDHLQQQQQHLPEAASPISSRPPPLAVSRPTNLEELVPAASGNFPDDDALGAGEEVERGVPGNRWPRQETLALLKIRSEMDATFRDATLKGPLWEDVSRKLAELGYTRSAKKCKEKFENVHKYYKRTKEGRAGRQDGKSYRFFSQLEALHGGSTTPTTTTTLPIGPVAATTSPNPSSSAPIGIGMPSSSGRLQPTPLTTTAPLISTPRAVPDLTAGAAAGISGAAGAAGISFSSNTSSSASSESDDEETEEGQPAETHKRKRHGSGGGGSRKMMTFFEGLMKQVMERQEAMQQRFLETIEKREQDRMIREEAWRRQEMTRVAKEQEAMAQDRAFAASRDTAIIAFLQKITGQTVHLPPPIVTPSPPFPHPVPTPPPPPLQQQLTPPPQQQQQPSQPQQQQQQQTTQPQPQPQQQQQHQHHHHQSTEIVRHQASSSEVVPFQEAQEVGVSMSMDPASSRWPKSEVHALIKLRSGLESRYQEAGPKGPLWEEISSGMRRMGFNRSSKRCKEKWENINKYFKKVKESNKKRPEDAKTCPYFHQLDALYRKKVISGAGAGGGNSSSMGNQNKQEQEINPNPQERTQVLAITAPPQLPPQADPESKNGNNNNGNRNGGNPDASGGSGLQIQTSNGGLPVTFFEEGTSGSAGAIKKPEDIVKELMEQQLPQQQQQAIMEDYDKLEEPDSDNIDQDDDDDDDEDDEDEKMAYQIQFQRQNVNGNSNSGGNPSAAATAGSFLAMVQ